MSAHSIAANFEALTNALLDIRATSSRYRGDGNPLHIVPVDGRFFMADNYELGLLQKGWTPEELELCECGDSFPEDE